MAEFVTVAKTTDIPENSGKTVEVNGTPVALFHSEGKFYAIHDTCPHAGGPLSEGELFGREVTCPWHAWTFDITTGKCVTLPTAKVACYEVEVVGDEVRVAV